MKTNISFISFIFTMFFAGPLGIAFGAPNTSVAVDENTAKAVAMRIAGAYDQSAFILENRDTGGVADIPYLGKYPGESRKVDNLKLYTTIGGPSNTQTIYHASVDILTDYGKYNMKFDLSFNNTAAGNDWSFQNGIFQRIPPSSSDEAAKFEKNRKIAAFWGKTVNTEWVDNCGTISSGKYVVKLQFNLGGGPNDPLHANYTESGYGSGAISPFSYDFSQYRMQDSGLHDQFVLSISSADEKQLWVCGLSLDTIANGDFNQWFEKYFDWAKTAKDNNVKSFNKLIYHQPNIPLGDVTGSMLISFNVDESGIPTMILHNNVNPRNSITLTSDEVASLKQILDSLDSKLTGFFASVWSDAEKQAANADEAAQTNAMFK